MFFKKKIKQNVCVILARNQLTIFSLIQINDLCEMQIDLTLKDISNTLLLILPESATKVEDLLARNEVNIVLAILLLVNICAYIHNVGSIKNNFSYLAMIIFKYSFRILKNSIFHTSPQDGKHLYTSMFPF